MVDVVGWVRARRGRVYAPIAIVGRAEPSENADFEDIDRNPAASGTTKAMDTNPRDLDALLAHSGWARALARSLVRDPGRADDLVQRAWLAALRTPPGDGTPPRRWLARVLRNFARQDAREASRRDRREKAVARPESAGGSDAVADSAEIQIRLITAVRELPEPNRSAVWARYYEGLAPREIAARDGVPVETVKTRIARGLESLRKRFDREHGGDRGAWMAALLPLAAPSASTVSVSGGLLMAAKWKVAAVLALVCATATWVVVANDEPASPLAIAEATLGVTSDLVESGDRTSDVEVATRNGTRTPITNAASLDGRTDADVHVPQVLGRVLDLEGHPVGGLEIGTARRDFETNVRSAADGTFSITREFAGHALEASGPGWATVWVDRIPRPGIDRRVTILVARAGRIRGIVQDDEGHPVEDAAIELRVDDAMCRTLSGLVDADPHRIGYAAVSGADGRFDLGVVPLVAGTVHGDVDGREARPVSIPPEACDDLVLELDPPAAADIVVRGSVSSGPAVFVPRAYVRVGAATQRTDRAGKFRLVVRPTDLRDDGAPIELVAVSENQCPTRVAFTSIEELASRAATETFDIVLGDDPLAITGRVVDWDGNPVVGASLRASEDRFGTVTVGVFGHPEREDRSVEAILRGDAGPDVESKASDGAFEIRGLQARDYRIVITSTELLAMSVLERVPAGTEDLVVVLDTRGAKQRVAGRVVDGGGQPVAGVSVTADVDLGFGGETLTSLPVSTDEAGAFVLDGLRSRIVQVCADLESFRVGVDVRRDTRLDDVRIVVPRQFAIQVDIMSKPGFATDFQVCNARGTVGLHSSRTVAARTISTVSETVAAALPIVDGRSDIVTVDEGDLTLVLLRNGQEVGRRPIVFAAEGVTILRP